MGFFFYLLKSFSKYFPFVTKYLRHLSFLYFLFIWLLISICKVLLDHLLTGSKQENCNSPNCTTRSMIKVPNTSSLFKGNFFFTKNSAEFRLYLGHPKLLTTTNLLNQPIITRSHNSRPYIKPHNSAPHAIHTIYIYIYIYPTSKYPTSKFNMNIVQTSYHKI